MACLGMPRPSTINDRLEHEVAGLDKTQSNKLTKNMKLITKILPQRKKYEKISKTHRKMKNIDWGEGSLEKALSYPNPNTPKTRKMPGLILSYYYFADILQFYTNFSAMARVYRFSNKFKVCNNHKKIDNHCFKACIYELHFYKT